MVDTTNWFPKVLRKDFTVGWWSARTGSTTLIRISTSALLHRLGHRAPNTVDGRRRTRPGSLIYEPFGLVHQWGNPGSEPLTFLAFNINPKACRQSSPRRMPSHSQRATGWHLRLPPAGESSANLASLIKEPLGRLRRAWREISRRRCFQLLLVGRCFTKITDTHDALQLVVLDNRQVTDPRYRHCRKHSIHAIGERQLRCSRPCCRNGLVKPAVSKALGGPNHRTHWPARRNVARQ